MEETLIKRTMPNSIEAEQSVIGAMMMDRAAIIAASETLAPEDFYHNQYGVLFDSMIELFNQSQPVDFITLQNKLKEKDLPPEISSLEYINDLVAAVPTAANIRYYANIVKEKAMLRRLIKITENIQNECYAGNEELETIFSNTEKNIFQLLQSQDSGEFVPIKQIVINALDRIEKASRIQGNVTGIATGFIDLDYRMSGLQPSDLILVAARPSMGKTAFVLNIAQYTAFHSDLATAIFSLEMSKEQLVNRLFSLESRVDAQMLRNGNLSDTDWEKLIEGAGTIGRSKLIIDDTPGISISELRSKCRKYKLEHNIQLIIIDYLQLMSSGKRRQENRVQEVSELTRNLKIMAKELNVPLITLSQLSRGPESRTDHKPMLSDLRESGSIEQDADIVMLLYREDYYNREEAEERNVALCDVAKNRHGEVATVKLGWDSRYTRFTNLEFARNEP